MTRIFLNTHGGLGNQLFQIFYALNIKQKLGASAVYIHHSKDFYTHRFSLEIEPILVGFERPIGLVKKIMQCRLPKILEKVGVNSGVIKLRNNIFLDGYFQEPDLYMIFEKEILNNSLAIIRQALDVDKLKHKKSLLHIRLGDFFSDENAKLEMAASLLEAAEIGQHVITNEEHLICQEWAKSLFLDKSLSLIETENTTGRELLKIFSDYEHITSNNSTLAFWAVLLSGGKLNINHPDLIQILSICNDSR